MLSQVKYEDMNSIVDYVNNNQFTWKAEVNPRFEGLTLAEINGRGNSKLKLLSKVEIMMQKTNTLAQTEVEAAIEAFTDNEKLLNDQDFIEAHKEASKYWDTPI